MVKFLIIRFSSIGDIVLTTPVVRCLKMQVEEAEVHYLTKAKYSGLLKSNPYIDHIHLLESNNYRKLIRVLKEENFDYIIDLHRNLRSFRIKQSLRRLAYSFHKLNFQKWLYVNFKINRLPNKHVVDRYLETIQIFSAENDGKGLDFFIPEAEKFSLEFLPEEYRKNFVVIVVGGGHKTKQIPSEKIIYLINTLEVPIVLLGGKEDILKSGKIITKVQKDKVFDQTGKIDITEAAFIISQARLVITPDTGLMHIAAALSKPIISVWGNTTPFFGMYPYKPVEQSVMFEVDGLKCRPCSKLGYEKCPKGHFRCMLAQDYEGMIATIKKIITS